MTTTTFSASATTAGSVVARSAPEETTRCRTGAAPGSSKGSVPAPTRATACSLTSYTATCAPLSASAIASGRPTWPHPPTITTSSGNSWSTSGSVLGWWQ
jgi:hypothetical protein